MPTATTILNLFTSRGASALPLTLPDGFGCAKPDCSAIPTRHRWRRVAAERSPRPSLSERVTAWRAEDARAWTAKAQENKAASPAGAVVEAPGPRFRLVPGRGGRKTGVGPLVVMMNCASGYRLLRLTMPRWWRFHAR